MNDTGKNIADGFRTLRKFCNDISLLLLKANEMMEEHGWNRISKWTPAVVVSGDLYYPDCWLPDVFFCFYENARFEQLLPYIAVHVEDLYDDHADMKEALISVGWIDFGPGKRAAEEWEKDYTWCDSHLWMKDRQDDGTLYTGDAREIWENPEYEPGSVKVCTFGYPLVAITDCETLKEKTVMRLLDELEKQPATRIKKKRLVASSRKKSRRG